MTAPPGDADLEAAARRLVAALVGRDWRLTTAESCTGGLVGHVITAIPGASDAFLGGIISYSNDAKEQLLNVPRDLLASTGAVSPEVARSMASGALAAFPEASLSVAVTGIAGPDGGTSDKPVGLTYVAAAVRGGQATVERHTWPHDRDGNKRASALAAIDLATRIATE
ncbi:MAG: CinA family protein [Chloroflexi bacterium]|nr:CinA family protein [Chloroflexota bacterium]